MYNTCTCIAFKLPTLIHLSSVTQWLVSEQWLTFSGNQLLTILVYTVLTFSNFLKDPVSIYSSIFFAILSPIPSCYQMPKNKPAVISACYDISNNSFIYSNPWDTIKR